MWAAFESLLVGCFVLFRLSIGLTVVGVVSVASFNLKRISLWLNFFMHCLDKDPSVVVVHDSNCTSNDHRVWSRFVGAVSTPNFRLVNNNVG
jgi:hypothetical protein